MKKTRIQNIQMLALLGMLTAIEIVLSRFCSISAWNVKISLSFLPVAAAAMLCGVRCGSFARGRDLRRTRCSACCCTKSAPRRASPPRPRSTSWSSA